MRKSKYRQTLHQQAYNILNAMQAYGESKRAADTDSRKDKIYSYNTYKTYKKHIGYYIDWVKQHYPDCRSLKAAKKYVNEWLQYRVEQTDNNGNHLSAWTIQTEAAALNKLYGIDKSDVGRFQPPRRRREDIKRSRHQVTRDKNFSAEKNAELINFCRATGCRRNVLEHLEGRDLWTKTQMIDTVKNLQSQQMENLSATEKKQLASLQDALSVFGDFEYFIYHRKDKNGKYRYAPVINNTEAVIERFKGVEATERVWHSVNSNADIHSYRADYATTLYKMYARQINEIPYDRINSGSKRAYQSDVYACRHDHRRLDKRAMRLCSKALGHNRLDVVANNYLRDV